MEPVQRRSFVGLAGLAMLPTPSDAGQQCVPESPQHAVEINKDRANDLLKFMGKLGLDTESVFPQIMRQEVALRFDLATYLDLHSSEDSVRDLIKVNVDGLLPPAKKLSKSELLPVNEIAAQAGRTVLPPKPPATPPCPDSVLDVIVAMFSDAMDMQEVSGILKKAVYESPELRDAFQNLANAVGANDWQKLFDAIAKIVDLFCKGAIAKALVDKLGKKAAEELSAKLLKRFLTRLVPFVGPVYVTITVAAAIFANRGRLETALKCKKLK